MNALNAINLVARAPPIQTHDGKSALGMCTKASPRIHSDPLKTVRGFQYPGSERRLSSPAVEVAWHRTHAATAGYPIVFRMVRRERDGTQVRSQKPVPIHIQGGSCTRRSLT